VVDLYPQGTDAEGIYVGKGRLYTRAADPFGRASSGLYSQTRRKRNRACERRREEERGECQPEPTGVRDASSWWMVVVVDVV